MVLNNWGIWPETNKLTVEELKGTTEYLSIIDR